MSTRGPGWVAYRLTDCGFYEIGNPIAALVFRTVTSVSGNRPYVAVGLCRPRMAWWPSRGSGICHNLNLKAVKPGELSRCLRKATFRKSRIWGFRKPRRKTYLVFRHRDTAWQRVAESHRRRESV